MFPYLAINNRSNNELRNEVLSCQFAVRIFTCAIVISNFLNLLCSKLRLVVSFSAKRSILYTHVCGVILWSSKLKMFWIYTATVIANMHNKRSIQDNILMNVIGKSVRFDVLIGKSKSLQIGGPDLKQSVSVFISRTNPNPTCIGLLNQFPESLYWVFRWSACHCQLIPLKPLGGN